MQQQRLNISIIIQITLLLKLFINSCTCQHDIYTCQIESYERERERKRLFGSHNKYTNNN